MSVIYRQVMSMSNKDNFRSFKQTNQNPFRFIMWKFENNYFFGGRPEKR